MLALLSALASAADEAPPPPDVLDEAHRRSTRGAVLLATGGLAMGGGLAVLLVREGGPADPIEDPAPTIVRDLRSAGGALLLMGGFVAVYGGGHDLGAAAGLRQRSREVTLLPTLDGVVLSGRF